MIRSVCDHVHSFIPVESHYCRKNSSKLYLDSNLTFKEMFRLYEQWFDPEKYSNKASTLRQYQDIVNKNINLEFHKPKKDQCDECETFKNLPKPINEAQEIKQKDHLRNKDAARTQKHIDKLAAINSNDTLTAAFDFQKIHIVPQGKTSIYYYKRKLNILNFTLFDMAKKIGTCYMWHESIAKRGSNEVASCIYDYIEEK